MVKHKAEKAAQGTERRDSVSGAEVDEMEAAYAEGAIGVDTNPAVDSPCADSPAPARVRASTFGDDVELATEPPPEWSLKRFQQEAKAALNEYFISLALEETVTRLNELLGKSPSEADELGVLTIRAVLDRGDDEAVRKAAVDLLQGLQRGSTGLDRPALVRSVEKLVCTWEDIAIDAPTAPQVLLQTLQSCIKAELVDRKLLSKVPENLLHAGLAKAGAEIRDMLAGVEAEIHEFKQQVSRSVEEYFVSLNVTEVSTFLKEIGMRDYRYEFVKKAATLSFTQGNVEAAREATMSLFLQLTSESVLMKDDLQWGVTRLLSALDDLALDCPKCVEYATELCSRMVADELVSVPFLRRCRLLRIGGMTGRKVLDDTQRRTPEYSKKNLDTAHFKRELQTMILEYFNSGDEAEFGRCVRELAPLSEEQSSELIRKVMSLAMERSGNECELALRLVVFLNRHEELTGDAVEQGFNEMYTRMPDLLLDVPDAREMARSFVVEAKRAGILGEDWTSEEAPVAAAEAA